MTSALVPAEIDLRDFEFMPLDVFRLRESDLAAIATGDEFRAAVMLWCACWHQVPASSLPSDDRVLAKLAGYARDLDGWLAVKIEAMRGFVECDDGRFYHPVIAEKAIEAWTKRLAFQARTEAARRAKAEAARAKENVASNVTGSVTETGALSVTASRDERGQGTVEIKEERTNFVGSAHAPERARAKPPAKACRLPETWHPSPDGLDLATKLIGAEAAERELAKFRDYWRAKAGRDGAKLDWNATWRNWIRNAADRMPSARAGPRQSGRDFLAQIALGNFENAESSNPPNIVELNPRPGRPGGDGVGWGDPQPAGTHPVEGTGGGVVDFGSTCAIRG